MVHWAHLLCYDRMTGMATSGSTPSGCGVVLTPACLRACAACLYRVLLCPKSYFTVGKCKHSQAHCDEYQGCVAISSRGDPVRRPACWCCEQAGQGTEWSATGLKGTEWNFFMELFLLSWSSSCAPVQHYHACNLVDTSSVIDVQPHPHASLETWFGVASQATQ